MLNEEKTYPAVVRIKRQLGYLGLTGQFGGRIPQIAECLGGEDAIKALSESQLKKKIREFIKNN